MRRRLLLPAGLVLAAALALTGCTPPGAEPTAWQSTVQAVANQASAGDYTSALATLDALEAEVVARRDAGTLAADEADGILSRIAAVRADLTSLTPTPTPTPAAEPTPDHQPTVSDDGGTDGGAPADPNDQGPGDNGKGKGPGKDDQGPGAGGGPGKKDG